MSAATIAVPIDDVRLALERLDCVPTFADPDGRTREAARRLRMSLAHPLPTPLGEREALEAMYYAGLREALRLINHMPTGKSAVYGHALLDAKDAIYAALAAQGQQTG